jgi:hypothetical protein
MSQDIDMQSYTGVIDQVAEGQEVFEQEVQQDTGALQGDDIGGSAGTTQPTDPDPLSDKEMNFRAIREQLDQMKQERDELVREHRLQVDLLRANLQPKQVEPEAPKAFKGMNDDDIPSVADLRRELASREDAYRTRIEELEFQQSHPDYSEVLNKYLAPLVKEKPYLAREIQNSQSPSAMAYELAKLAEQARGNQMTTEPKKNANAQRIVENARKPGTLSQAGGQGALSKADYYESMSDEDFYRLASKNLET